MPGVRVPVGVEVLRHLIQREGKRVFIAGVLLEHAERHPEDGLRLGTWPFRVRVRNNINKFYWIQFV